MATATLNQEASFIKRWEPSAQQASLQLGIPASYVLAQWAYETGWGTQPHMGHNNPGNIMSQGHLVNFSSISQFLQQYESAVSSDFPYIQIAMMNENGTVVPASPATVFGGNQKYAVQPKGKSPNWYGEAVQGVYKTVENILKGHTNAQNLSQWNSGLRPSVGGIEAEISKAVDATIKDISSPLSKVMWGFVGIISIIFGIILLSREEIKNVA